MRVLFLASHTLYWKVLLPVALELTRRGVKVSIRANRPSFMKYSQDKCADHPTGVRWVNRSALEYIADLAGYREDLNQALKGGALQISMLSGLHRHDAVIGVVKDFDPLLKRSGKKHEDVYVLGYQHLPVLLSLKQPLKNKKISSLCERVFLQSEFSNLHRFSEWVLHPAVKDREFVNFPYLDKIKQTPGVDGAYALVFHPGGYRHVDSDPGDDQATCYRKQERFIRDVCGPVLAAGLIPVIKVHPLYARHHSKADLEAILAIMIQKDPEFRSVIVTDQPYWDYARQSRWIVTFGSSSVYELFAAGFWNVLICDFLGKARSVKFEAFEGLFVRSLEDYAAILKQKPSRERLKQGPAAEIFEAYHSLNHGKAASQVADHVVGGG